MKAQEQRAKEMNDDSNQLIEHYNVVKRACKLIYGEESLKSLVGSKRVEHIDKSSGSSDDALNSSP